MQHEITVFEKNSPPSASSSDGSRYYRLSWIGGSFWLANQAGEGVGLSEKNVFDVLDEHFKSEF